MLYCTVELPETAKTSSSSSSAGKTSASSSRFSEPHSASSSALAPDAAAHQPKSKWELMDQQESIFPPDDGPSSSASPARNSTRSDSPPRFVCLWIIAILNLYLYARKIYEYSYIFLDKFSRIKLNLLIDYIIKDCMH